VKESDLKKTVKDYLQIGMNQGKWYYDRLNSGYAFVGTPQHPRRIKLCCEGTSDFMVIMGVPVIDQWDNEAPIHRGCLVRLIFLELKSEKGKQRQEQEWFQRDVEEQGASYFIIHSIEELQEILG